MEFRDSDDSRVWILGFEFSLRFRTYGVQGLDTQASMLIVMSQVQYEAS